MKKETMITLGIALAALVFVKFSGSMDIRQSKMSTVPVNQFEAPKAGDKIAVISTNHGEIKLRFFPEATPKAYENFTKLSEKGYYNGTKFHRVIKDFMIQGGDPKGDGTGEKASGESPSRMNSARASAITEEPSVWLIREQIQTVASFL